jgi:hypothetical protein
MTSDPTIAFLLAHGARGQDHSSETLVGDLAGGRHTRGLIGEPWVPMPWVGGDS